MTNEELLEYAKKHYPIGTRYIPAHVNRGLNEVIRDDHKTDSFKTIHVTSENIKEKWNNTIYYNGKWAEIVSKPEENKVTKFEVGKWYKLDTWRSLGVNCIENSNSEIVYTQYIESNGVLKYSNASVTQNLHLVKEVTKEIQQYLPENHPDKIKPVENKSLVGRYLKALVDYPSAGSVKKGEYDLIKTESLSCVDFPSQKNYSAMGALKRPDLYELMPEGFEPPKEEVKKEIPEYVECIEEQPQFGNYGELGKIYKVVEWNYSSSDCMLKGTTSGSTARKRFKPSTKEAYDKQQRALGLWNDKVEEEWVPQVGDWVVIKSNGSSINEYNNTAKKGDIVKITDIRPIGGLATKEDPRYFGDTFNLRKKGFRKAEPHEIPKENPENSNVLSYNTADIDTSKKEPEIDSWCVKATKENQELLKQNKHLFKCDWNFNSLNDYYGIDKCNENKCTGITSIFNEVLTTKEFCKKFNITQIQYQLQSQIQNTKEKNTNNNLMYKTKQIKTFKRNF